MQWRAIKDLAGQNTVLWPVLLLALTLLFHQAWVPGFFPDGDLYAAFSKNALEKGHWLVPHMTQEHYSQFSQHSPFIFILQALYFALVGVGYTQARIFGGLFTLATLLVLYRWLKGMSGQKLAFYACVLFILIPPLLKKSRFPNMDIPLMFFVLSSIYCYWRSRLLTAGLFFGLALLTKGPMGLLVPGIIFVHILLTKNWIFFRNLRAWSALILGAAIFSLWPLALVLAGKGNIFIDYLNFTFIHTIVKSRGEGVYDPFFYAWLLVLQGLPWVALALWGCWSQMKRNGEVVKLFGAGFLGVFVPLSLATFKYSNYLIPAYPFLATLAALPLSRFDERIGAKIVHVGAMVVALVLLTFPLTVQVRRNPWLHKAAELVDALGVRPKSWGIVDNAHPFYPVANFLAFHNGTECVHVGMEGLSEDMVFLIKENALARLMPSVFSKFIVLSRFKKKGLALLVPRKLFSSQSLLTF